MQFCESMGHNHYVNEYISWCLCSFLKLICHLETIANVGNVVPHFEIKCMHGIQFRSPVSKCYNDKSWRKAYKPLINDSTIKFYARYVDDTLFVNKCEVVNRIQNALNNFDPNLSFTVNLFQKEVPHFLHLQLPPDSISIFRKNTNTDLYTRFSSYVPQTHGTAWIKSLTSCASRICSPNKLSSKINFVKKLASWNGFHIFLVKRTIHQVLNTTD